MNYEGETIPQDGDLLFYKSNGRSWLLSKLISKYSHAAGEDSKYGRYCHVAMVNADGNSLLEMTWPRAKETKLDIPKLSKHYDLELWRVHVGIWNKTRALEWAYRNLGMKYDWSLLLFGLFDDKHKEVCSSFIRQAYLYGGVELYPGAQHEKVVSPSELTTSYLLQRVW